MEIIIALPIPHESPIYAQDDIFIFSKWKVQNQNVLKTNTQNPPQIINLIEI